MSTTTIYCNRPFPGETPDDVELTLERLAAYTLQAQGATRTHPEYPGQLFIFGNFAEFSGAFAIATDDAATIERLITAFKRNPGCRLRWGDLE